jgi:ketosteroid isomerase-like protein
VTTAPVPDWFTKALDALRRGDTAAFVSMYADDATHDVPLAPEGRPRELVGKTAIAE